LGVSFVVTPFQCADLEGSKVLAKGFPDQADRFFLYGAQPGP
jgi:hypothetical protein